MAQKPHIPICKAAAEVLRAMNLSAPPRTITGKELLRVADECESQEEAKHD